jgi:hypothetical protein
VTRRGCRGTALALALLAAAPFASAEELKDADAIVKHLEFFGYTVERKPDHLQASHPQNVNFNVKPLRGGTLFITFFSTEDAAKDPAQRAGVLELVNAFNVNSVLVNFFIDADGDLGASAWFPGAYDKTTFGALVDRWNSDIKEALQRDPEKSRALIR